MQLGRQLKVLEEVENMTYKETKQDMTFNGARQTEVRNRGLEMERIIGEGSNKRIREGETGEVDKGDSELQVTKRNDGWIKKAMERVEQLEMQQSANKTDTGIEFNKVWAAQIVDRNKIEQLVVLGEQATELTTDNMKLIADKLVEVTGVLAEYQIVTNTKIMLLEYEVNKANKGKGPTTVAMEYAVARAEEAGVTLPEPRQIIGYVKPRTIKPLQLVEGRLVDNKMRRESEVNMTQVSDRNTERTVRFIEDITSEYKEGNKPLEIENGEQKGSKKGKQQETKEQNKKVKR